jgi:hypothetical protein
MDHPINPPYVLCRRTCSLEKSRSNVCVEVHDIRNVEHVKAIVDMTWRLGKVEDVKSREMFLRHKLPTERGVPSSVS